MCFSDVVLFLSLQVFLQLTRENAEAEGGALSVSETVSDTGSIDSFSSDLSDSISNFSDRISEFSSPFPLCLLFLVHPILTFISVRLANSVFSKSCARHVY